MRKIWKFSLCISIAVFLIQLCLTGSLVSAKEGKKEEVFDDNETMWVVRKDYGLIAKDVSRVKIGESLNLWEIFLQQKGQKEVKEVDLFHKKKQTSTYYKMNIVFTNSKDYFPMMDRSLCIDKNNRLLLTGKEVCNLFANHSTEAECENSLGKHRNEVVQEKVSRSKCWSDNDMFAYVNNNSLYITGCAAIPPGGSECYQYDTVKMFFEGKANEIKEVVCGECDGYGNSNIFVLMKNGSVWGMGSNKNKMLSQSDNKYYSDFIKIIPGGVKSIAANSKNVAMIKKNGSLYVWGKTLKSGKKSNSFKPEKIAKNVKEVSISDAEYEGGSILLYLKKNGTAYGLGENTDFALTDKYKKGWHSKPVMLRKKIKHVYAAPTATFLLDKKGELYWTGTQNYYPQYNWVNKKGKSL